MFFRSAVGALCAGLIASSAGAAERIEFMFPAPVQGKLSREMQKLVKEFNSSQDGVEVVGLIFAGGKRRRQVAGGDAILRAERHRMLDGVLELAHIARPAMANEGLGGVCVELWPLTI